MNLEAHHAAPPRRSCPSSVALTVLVGGAARRRAPRRSGSSRPTPPATTPMSSTRPPTRWSASSSDVEIVHGVTSAPDGSRIYLSNESLHTLDMVDGKTLNVTKRIHLSGRPNNVAVTNDGRKVYVGIAQAPGALDVIDTVTLANVKTSAGHRLHPQRLRDPGRQVRRRRLDPAEHHQHCRHRHRQDGAHHQDERRHPADDLRQESPTARPGTSTCNCRTSTGWRWSISPAARRPSGSSTRRLPGEHAHTDGLQGAPAHGLGVSPDGKTLWSTSKVYSHAYVFSLPDLKPIGTVFVGQHPEWVTFTPGQQVRLHRGGRRQHDLRGRRADDESGRADSGRPGAEADRHGRSADGLT